jgi:hypothetical protein
MERKLRSESNLMEMPNTHLACYLHRILIWQEIRRSILLPAHIDIKEMYML